MSDVCKRCDRDFAECGCTQVEQLKAIIEAQASKITELEKHLDRMLLGHAGIALNAIEFGRWVKEAREARGRT